MLELIQKLTKYNLWANSKLIGFFKKIDPSLLDKEIISSFNTLRKTLFHVWDAEKIWYNRLNGISLKDWSSKYFKGTDEDAFRGFTDQSEKYIKLSESMTEDDLYRVISYKTTGGKEYANSTVEIIQQVMNHSTFHRGQMITMLRNAGFTELESTDYITYLRNSG